MSLLEKATIITTPTAYSNGKLHSVKGGLIADFDVVRNSQATRVNKDGLIEIVGANVPRLDYTDGGCPVLLTEPQSANLITYSEDFSDGSWILENTTVVANSAVSPDGSLNADKIIATAINSSHSAFISLSSSTSSGASYCYSFFAKAEEYTKTAIRIGGGGYSTQPIAVINLLNGSVVSQQGFTSISVKNFSNGWYKINAVFTATSSVAPNIQPIADGFTTTSDNYTYNGDGTSGVYIFGAQLEALPYSTSYIPTSGAIATRLADSITGAGDATTINSTEGVLMVEIAALANDLTDRSLSLSSGSYSNRIELRYNNSSNGIRVFGVVGGAFQFDSSLSLNLPNITNQSKLAIKYKENNFALWVNGFEVYSDLSGSIFSEGVLNEIKFSDAQGGSPFYGNTSQVQYFNTALTDLELEKLTSWASFSDMANALNYTIQ